ncbi:UDP-N-acetylglucosamine 1-carboxyvinyltransferase [Mailhella massiliensis]|uniref:UDP-N-acetylglucosamine 1-carboxyvinyltransferase n=1 Tax=Mailhella massiliensis TaxID=1903261 RepID=A0A921DR19_9BACT|nr:UDP-N-acetylglucosamine 1-carboxyvinyltransferase [Mailhella massiliensis]HJD96498.1 UDP-N-acetylglucosamine 1-carboxyvinyltransferase [Mailhella massiliensis]
MDSFLIQGGVPLRGVMEVSGSKNAALPVIMASIAVNDKVTYTNVPDLRDIHTTIKLLNMLGREASLENGVATLEHGVLGLKNGVVTVKNGELGMEAPYELVKTMRASVLCLGPLLARRGEARVSLPGGCAIGARPVDQHLSALEKMGAVFDLESGYIHGRCPGGLKGAHIRFDFPTVGGTENVLMASCLAKGETVLENVAREPEIVDLASFLISCGARIEGQGSNVIRVQGVEKLHGCTYAIMPDRIEAGTFLIAAGVTGGELLLKNCPLGDMDAVVEKLREAGMSIEETPEGVLARVGAEGLRGVDISTRPHPGFPTDMQAQFMVLLCCAQGSGLVEENIFENRFMHVQELVRMGADIHVRGSSAMVRGGRRLTGAPVMASDLRAGAALVLAALAAEGETRVQRIYHVDRGYEHLAEKLSAVGARICRVKEPD